MKTQYKNLEVWEKSMQLTEKIFILCEKLPKSVVYSLADQMRRASLSIPSNIAEGMGRTTSAELIRFLTIARGSAMELETQVILARRLGYIEEDECGKITQDIETALKLVSGFIRYKRNLSDNPKS